MQYGDENDPQGLNRKTPPAPLMRAKQKDLKDPKDLFIQEQKEQKDGREGYRARMTSARYTKFSNHSQNQNESEIKAK